jgi:hypothetical protein
MVQQKCQVCLKNVDITSGWGFVSCCCGSFFCNECAKSMTTNKVIIKECDSQDIKGDFIDNENYYCVVCHKINPLFFVNSIRNTSYRAMTAQQLIQQYIELNNDKLISFDYYFYMFLHGFKPKFNQGRTICSELEEDYDKTLLNEKSFSQLIQPLYPKDRLTSISISVIDTIYKKLEIKPNISNEFRSCVLFYDCPDYMQKRVQQYFEQFSKNKESNFYGVDIVFKKDMSSLIGLHRNILAIIVWNEPSNKDEIHQLIGRILRLNNWNNPLYFYITCKSNLN